MKADFIFTNAKAITFDSTNPFADTLAVRDNKIVYVGIEQDSQSFRNNSDVAVG